MSRRPTNWAGNQTFHVEHVHHPASLDELRKLVQGSRRLRVLGSGHSFNAIADTDSDLVSLAGLPPIIDVAADARTVAVGGGVRYGELSAHLHAAGRALQNLGSLPHISVAGSCATATHGSGVSNPNLATAVTAMTMVTAAGDIMSIDATDDAFPGAVVHLGALGVVVDLTLRLEATYDVQQFVFDQLPLDTLTDHFDEIVSAAHSVSLFTGWRDRVIDQAWVKHRPDRDGPWAASSSWFGAKAADGPRHPLPGVSPAHCTQQLGVPGPWHERLPHFRLDFTPSSGEELQSEYFVPRTDAVDAIHALAGMRERIAPLLQVCEIRCVAADELWLSPAYGRDVVAFHFTWHPDTAGVLSLLPELEDTLAPFSVVPHWAKLFTMAPETLAARLPRLAGFAALARRYDPDGMFRNEFIDRYVFGR